MKKQECEMVRKSRDNLTFIEKRTFRKWRETVGRNRVRIMRREYNKESSSETSHSCLSLLKVALLLRPLFLHLLSSDYYLYTCLVDRLSGSHTYTQRVRDCAEIQ